MTKNDKHPVTRKELNALFERTTATPVFSAVQRWLLLDEEYSALTDQIHHVHNVLGDRVLGTMLRERADNLAATMLRQAEDIIRKPASQAEDIVCKCYVHDRLTSIRPDGETAAERLQDSILKDTEALGLTALTPQDRR